MNGCDWQYIMYIRTVRRAPYNATSITISYQLSVLQTTGRQNTYTHTQNGRSWLAGFEAPKCTFFFLPCVYISDPTKLTGYMFGTVGWYSNHQKMFLLGLGCWV